MGHGHHEHINVHEHDHAYMHEHNIPHEHEETAKQQHDHAYMHEHNIPHDHPHEGEHTHEHVHEHSCEHEHAHAHCGGDCHNCSGDPRAELVAIMDYMVKHNAAHANELAGLAKQVRDLGDTVSYEQIMAAVSDFEKGNMRLSAVLAGMNMPKA